MVTFINPHAWALAETHNDYVSTLHQMTLVLPDGEGVARACRELTEKPCPRLSFDMSSLADPFFGALRAAEASLMLIGGVPGVNEGVQAKLHANYGEDLRVIGTAHGYDSFETKIASVMLRQPDVVVVGMGSPRQEKFLVALRDAGYNGMAITCGGFLDQYLKKDYYYPRWINYANLRFAWRIYKEPKRLWRRYLIDYQVMTKLVLKAFYKKYASPLKSSSAKIKK
ncbi:hypothetical protein AXW84_22330 [Hymenobacter sp. PAMC 26628]|nr:hypothetical protein AXW84_22330 [Hymenobacter sp. PAMC 26628]